jgi:hypothetical protein
MTNLLELARDIVVAHLNLTPLSSVDLLQEVQQVYAVLHDLEAGRLEKLHTSQGGGSGIATRRRKPSASGRRHHLSRTQSLLCKYRLHRRKELDAILDLEANLEKARAARKSVAFVANIAPPSPFYRRMPGPRDHNRPRR